MEFNEKFDESDVSLKLFVVLLRATKAITEQVKGDIRSHGLNPAEFSVLELLYHKGNQPIQQIGEKILLASGSITYVVDNLEKKGYLGRKPCPKDRRVKYAVISEKGTALMIEIFPKHRERIHKIFGGLESEEKEEMIKQLKKLGFHAEDL